MQLGIGPDGPVAGRRVAITGLGAVTCCGVGVDALWDGLLHPSVVGGAVRDFEPEQWFGPKEVRQVDPFAQFAVASAAMAVADAGELDVDPAKAGVVFATGVGGLETLAGQVARLRREGRAPRVATPRPDDDGQRRCGRHLHASRMARPLRGDLHRVRRGHPCDRRRRSTGGLGSMRSCHRRWLRSQHAPGGARRVRQHDCALDHGNFAPLRRTARRFRHDRGCGRAGPRGLGPRRRPRCANSRRAGRRSQHRRRASHHRAVPGRLGGRRLHGAGSGRRRDRAGRCGPHQRARDLDAAQRPGRVAAPSRRCSANPVRSSPRPRE